MFGMLKGLVGSKSLTREDMEPVLEKMKDHLIGATSHISQLPLSFSSTFKMNFSVIHSSYNPIAKNVAADISSKLCDSVAIKLEGKVMGTFTSK